LLGLTRQVRSELGVDGRSLSLEVNYSLWTGSTCNFEVTFVTSCGNFHFIGRGIEKGISIMLKKHEKGTFERLVLTCRHYMKVFGAPVRLRGYFLSFLTP